VFSVVPVNALNRDTFSTAADGIAFKRYLRFCFINPAGRPKNSAQQRRDPANLPGPASKCVVG